MTAPTLTLETAEERALYRAVVVGLLGHAGPARSRERAEEEVRAYRERCAPTGGPLVRPWCEDTATELQYQLANACGWLGEDEDEYPEWDELIEALHTGFCKGRPRQPMTWCAPGASEPGDESPLEQATGAIKLEVPTLEWMTGEPDVQRIRVEAGLAANRLRSALREAGCEDWNDRREASPPADDPACNELSARWCPRCGDCACTVDEDESLWPIRNAACPLHGDESKHREDHGEPDTSGAPAGPGWATLRVKVFDDDDGLVANVAGHYIRADSPHLRWAAGPCLQGSAPNLAGKIQTVIDTIEECRAELGGSDGDHRADAAYEDASTWLREALAGSADTGPSPATVLARDYKARLDALTRAVEAAALAIAAEGLKTSAVVRGADYLDAKGDT